MVERRVEASPDTPTLQRDPAGTVSSEPDEAEDWRILPRILIVDDEPSVVDVLQEFLASQGYDLSVARTGEEAVRVIPQLRPDIILTDINLPGVSGLHVMKEAKTVDP